MQLQDNLGRKIVRKDVKSATEWLPHQMTRQVTILVALARVGVVTTHLISMRMWEVPFAAAQFTKIS